jgi:hypothetical protein
MTVSRQSRGSRTRSGANADDQPAAVSDDDRAALLALADDLPRLWHHPAASAEIRKRILRAVLNEIVVTVEPDRLHLMLHWQGGDHTRLDVVKNRVGQHRWKTDAATEELIRELACMLPDQSIASVLNRLGMRSAKGHTWTQVRVRNFRCEYKIAIYREGERAERRELNPARGGNPAGRKQDDRHSLDPGWAVASKAGLHRRALCDPGG